MRRVGRVLATVVVLFGYVGLSACATTQTSPTSDPVLPDIQASETPPDDAASTDVALPTLEPDVTPSLPVPTAPPTTPPTAPLPPEVVDVPDVGLGAAVEPVTPEPVLEQPNPFMSLSGWTDGDHAPALAAFKQSCKTLLKRARTRPLHSQRPALGNHGDWTSVCRAADLATDASLFFESLFVPLTVSAKAGLLTGYYEPEVDVRAAPDAIYSEPILAVPTSDAVRKLPRAELSADSAEVIAYGRPIDVFFLHVQGSGRLHFDDGRTLRAGYAANNGKSYRSIGRVLIDRGELTREQSSKRNIEEWMAAAGLEKSRELMNENPRYIFFAKQDIPDGQGPKGAMQVPLTAMGSVAIDPSYNPYGIPIWLETRLPEQARDYRGTKTGLLVITQDTGSAIKGPQRGDLFFGAGRAAGARAGVMKHEARWTLLIPRKLAERLARQARQDVSEPVA